MGGVTVWRWCAEWYSGMGNEGEAMRRGRGLIQGREQSGGDGAGSSGRVCGAGGLCVGGVVRERRRAKRVREERGRVCGGYGGEEREDGYREEEREDGESGQ